MLARLLLTSLVLVVTPCEVSAQLFGEVPFQRPDFQPFAQSPGDQVSSRYIKVIIPEDRKSMVAYSLHTGEFHKVTFNSPLPLDAQPVLSAEVAAIKTPDGIYGFASFSGRWSRLNAQVSPLARTMVSQDAIEVISNDQLFILSAKANDWTGVDMKTGEILNNRKQSEVVPERAE